MTPESVITKDGPTRLSAGQLLDSIPSTNQYVSELWSRLPSHFWVAAREQTAGRGRLGRTWDSAPSSSLLMSILVPMPIRKGEPALATMAAALATRSLILQELPGADVQLKWPNDVLLGGQKVAGILAEYAGRRGDEHLVVVGVGLNLTVDTEALSHYGATSLAQNGWSRTGIRVPDSEIIRLSANLADLMKRALSEDSIVSRFQEHCATLGQDVTALLPGGQSITGWAGGIAANGELLVGDVPVRAGEVTLAKTVDLKELS